MTYDELSKIKTAGFTTNHVIDDVVNNGRFCYSKASFKTAQVPNYEIERIMEWARREGCEVSTAAQLAYFEVPRRLAATLKLIGFEEVSPEIG